MQRTQASAALTAIERNLNDALIVPVPKSDDTIAPTSIDVVNNHSHTDLCTFARSNNIIAPLLNADIASSSHRQLWWYATKVSIPPPESSPFLFNPVGRLIGPRGMTMRRLEQITGCRMLIRGRGSVKDPRKATAYLGRPGWEHLSEPPHVYIKATRDTLDEAKAAVAYGAEHVLALLQPVEYDELKRNQLMHLAILNQQERDAAADSHPQ